MVWRKWMAVAGVLAALHAFKVQAQGSGGTSPGNQTAIELPGIVVTTANKRPQRTQPRAAPPGGQAAAGDGTSEPEAQGTSQPSETADASVSVRSGAELKAAGVEKVADLEKVFPGLTIRTRGNRAYANFTVRGLSSPDFYNPSVQVLIDGVPQAAASFTQDLVDVERVEFLRGPQGVLYGANAYGGVLNIITRQPRETTAAVSGTVSNLRAGAQASATGVLAPNSTFLDVAVKREWDRGEIDDILTGEANIDSGNLFAGRVSLRYAPLDGPFDAALTYTHDRVKTHEEFYLRDEAFKERKYDLTIPYPFLDRRTETVSANWNYRLGSGFTLTGISAFQDVDLTRDIFSAHTPESERAFSQEVRLAYAGPGPLSGVAGIYLRNSDFTRETSTFADRNDIGTDTLAAFGELTWHVTRQLDVTGGVRVTRDRSSIDYALPAFSIAATDEAEFHSTQPKIAVGYQLSELTRVYALVSQGYKPGGFQHTINPLNPDFEAYQPETAWNYETGVRTSLLHRSLDLTAAIYHIVSEDKQIFVGPVGAQIIRNASEAESTGIELEAQWRATERLTLLGTANIGHSRFTDFVDPITNTDYTGNHVPYAPDITATLQARYVLDQRLFGASAALLGAMRFASKTYFDEGNTLSQGAFATYDAALELAWDNGTALKLFANNITDEIYREYSFRFGPQVLSLPSEGRLLGVILSAKY